MFYILNGITQYQQNVQMDIERIKVGLMIIKMMFYVLYLYILGKKIVIHF